MKARTVGILIVSVVLVAALQTPATSQCGGGSASGSGCGGGHDHGKAKKTEVRPDFSPLHHGSLLFTKANAFETVLARDGVRIYRYSVDGAPRLFGPVEGRVEVVRVDGSKEKIDLERRDTQEPDAVWFCTMHPSFVRSQPGDCGICGMKLVAHDFLFASSDLVYRSGASDAAVTEIKVRIKGLGRPEKNVEFIEEGYAADVTARGSESDEVNTGGDAGAEHQGHVH